MSERLSIIQALMKEKVNNNEFACDGCCEADGGFARVNSASGEIDSVD